ncbi:hypothetical protein AVEN_25647-1 [Araneus ventricosus]|uniref:Uncharacterized protein n=1 Tax=Araneus ventricosus TaxID=182803 RepID=A0A4Y2BPX2_ARAVE|nr:hypothetical protein AVEN_25647-1 [Araneus ventricosus]
MSTTKQKQQAPIKILILSIPQLTVFLNHPIHKRGRWKRPQMLAKRHLGVVQSDPASECRQPYEDDPDEAKRERKDGEKGGGR